MINEIKFTDSAINKIEKLISKKPIGTYFRIAVKGGGCSGLKYDFSFDKEIDKTDIIYNKVVMDSSSVKILKGSEIDFQSELIGESFKINNPKAKSSCGCGISFSMS